MGAKLVGRRAEFFDFMCSHTVVSRG